ncbi:MAG: DUF1003 domain-containing protein [Candidatus Woesearchaeota archaeon]
MFWNKNKNITKVSEKLFQEKIKSETMSIDEVHSDVEKRLEEQGFIFDKQQFIFQDKDMTLGDKLADKIAAFGGSWGFISFFFLFILAWMLINIIIFMNRGYDPYPFILLNLILSCLAAIQAPIIMMSQNRQAKKDRKQQEINLEKDIVDFKQDRLDLILDQKQWELLLQMSKRIENIEKKLNTTKTKPIKKNNKNKINKK